MPTVRVKLDDVENTILKEALQSVRIGVGSAPSQAIFTVRDKTVRWNDYPYSIGQWVSIDIKCQDQENWTEIFDGDIVVIRPHKSVNEESVDLVCYDFGHRANFASVREWYNRDGYPNKDPDNTRYATQEQQDNGTAVYWQPKDMIYHLITQGYPEYVNAEYFTLETDDIEDMTIEGYKTEMRFQDVPLGQALDRVTQSLGNWTWWSKSVTGGAGHKYMPIDLAVGTGDLHTFLFATAGAEITEVDSEYDATQLVSRLSAYGGPDRFEFTVDNESDYSRAGLYEVGKIQEAWDSSLEAAVEAESDPTDFVKKNSQYTDVYRKYQVGYIRVYHWGAWYDISRSNRFLQTLLSTDPNDENQPQQPRLEIYQDGEWQALDKGEWTFGPEHTIKFARVLDEGTNLGSRNSDFSAKTFRLTFAVSAETGRQDGPYLIVEARNPDAPFDVERKIANTEYWREYRDSIDVIRGETTNQMETLKDDWDELSAWADEQLEHYETRVHSSRIVLPEPDETVVLGDKVTVADLCTNEIVLGIDYTFGMSPRQTLTVGNLLKRTGRENINKMKQEAKEIKERQAEIEKQLEPPQTLGGGGGGGAWLEYEG
jgi:hypothetical protein